MEPYEPHLAIATALAVGVLIGLEREQAHPEAERTSFAGVRTYPIIAVIGALATMLEPASLWLPLIALAGVIVLLAIAYADNVRKGREHSVTTETSVIATYLLGALAASHGILEPMATRLLLVVALGVALTFLLSSKQLLHGIAARVSRDDFYATVKFLIVAVIVLPLLPRHGVGPLEAINPFTVGLMVVTISGLSFIGYVGMRLLGAHKGLLVSGAAGGLVSSTAVTMSFAGRARRDPAIVPAASGAIAIASTIMLVRIAVLIAIVNVALLPHVAGPLALAAIGAMAGGLLTFRRGAPVDDETIALKNPFELGTAIRFGFVFAVILLATKAATTYLGSQGLYLASAIAGTTDVDAVTLSSASLASSGTDARVVTLAILIAAAVNTLVKSALALFLGNRALGKRALVIGGLTIAGGALGLVLAQALGDG